MTTSLEPVRPTSFTTGHVGLNVTDLDRSKRFYQGVFGFSLMAESSEGGRHFAFLAQEQTLMLTLWQQSTGTFAPDRPGLHHLSFQVGSLAEVQSAEERLRALGVAIHHDGVVPHAEGLDSGGIFFADPDGTRLEIFTGTGVGTHAPAVQGAVPTCGFF